MRYVEIESFFDQNGINEGCQRKKHDDESECVAGAGLDAEESADARDEDEHSECGGENAEKIERDEAVPSLYDGRNAREYVDEADNAPDLFIFAFCHFYYPFSVCFILQVITLRCRSLQQRLYQLR